MVEKNEQTGLSEFETISYELYSEIFEDKKKRDIFLRKLQTCGGQKKGGTYSKNLPQISKSGPTIQHD